MKNNKFFIMMLLGAAMMSGTSFGAQGQSYWQRAGQLYNAMPSASEALRSAHQAIARHLPGRETMSTWANKVVSILSENRKEALFAALALALGGSYYAYQQYLSRQNDEATKNMLMNAIKKAYNTTEDEKKYGILLREWKDLISEDYDDQIFASAVNALLSKYYLMFDDKKRNEKLQQITKQDVAAARRVK